ncbi:hypothetical protein JB92DRAFT_2838368 [Gautieria morchelliformis]|nr:hypothetical protein JB92DRAFT_2838368 [Gautieria morchelliformis]
MLTLDVRRCLTLSPRYVWDESPSVAWYRWAVCIREVLNHPAAPDACPYPNLDLCMGTGAGGHVNTTTGYQLVGGTGIGDIGTQPATRRSKATVGKIAWRSGRDGRAASSAAAVQVAALMGGYGGGWWARPWLNVDGGWKKRGMWREERKKEP